MTNGNSTNTGHLVEPEKNESHAMTFTFSNSAEYNYGTKDLNAKRVGSSRRKQREPQKLSRLLVLNNNDIEKGDSLEEKDACQQLAFQCHHGTDNPLLDNSAECVQDKTDNSECRSSIDCTVNGEKCTQVYIENGLLGHYGDLPYSANDKYVVSILDNIKCEPPDTEDALSDEGDDFPKIQIGKCVNLRRSYTREEKIQVLDWYYRNGRNKYKTSKLFGLNTRTLGKWIAAEKKIRHSREGSMRAGSGRKPFWMEMEEELYRLYKEEVLRCGGDSHVAHTWFREKSEQIMKRLDQSTDFKFSVQWLAGFKRRYIG